MQAFDTSIAFGRFRMDLTRRILLVDGQPVALHARAFDILDYLVACRDRAVTRDEIIGHVWRGVVVGENNLSVQMSTLRRVLAQHGGENLIVTVPHRGYQFIDSDPAVPRFTQPKQQEVDDSPEAKARAPSREDIPAKRPDWRWPAAGGIAVAAILIATILALREGPTTRVLKPSTVAQAFNPPPHSVAVLAFTNLSGEPAQDYLSDGLSEELIESLSQMRQVQVTARTSSFFFKGKQATIKDIALALNVAAVVEGSVRRQGNHLRIEARLTDARTGFQLWSHPFDSNLGDMLKLEDEIAAQVADALQVKLAAGDAPDSGAGGTTNARALDAYLRGVQSIRHDSVLSYNAALGFFNAAIDADPNFALAYAGKANALILKGNDEDTAVPPSDGRWSEALGAANRSVQLAPGIGATHIALANVFENSLNLRGAWIEAERAETLTQGVATIDLIFSYIALSVGHGDAALRAARRAVGLDPLREDGWFRLGEHYRFTRDYDNAFKAYQHAQTLAGSETPLVAFGRALAYIAMGNYQRALEISLGGSDWSHLECRAIAQHALGQQRDAEQTVATLLKMDGDNDDYVYANIFAQWHQPTEALIPTARMGDSR